MNKWIKLIRIKLEINIYNNTNSKKLLNILKEIDKKYIIFTNYIR